MTSALMSRSNISALLAETARSRSRAGEPRRRRGHAPRTLIAAPPSSRDLPEAGELRRSDPPLARDLDVRLLVVAVALRDAGAVVEDVGHRPDRRRRDRTGELDLRHEAVVDGDGVLDEASHPLDDRPSPPDGRLVRLRVHEERVLGEELAELVPPLRVHEAEVARLQLPDRLVVLEPVSIHAGAALRGKPYSPRHHVSPRPRQPGA